VTLPNNLRLGKFSNSPTETFFVSHWNNLLAAWRGARMTFTLPITTLWCVVTAVMMVLDLVACAMFGADYGKILLVS
jgi:hypothetical protein